MGSKRIPAKFFKTEAGNEPVREWLKQLAPENCKVIGIDIKTMVVSANWWRYGKYRVPGLDMEVQ